MSKLKEYCTYITDGEHGSVIDDVNGQYYLLSNKNIIGGNIVITDADRKISDDSFNKISNRCKLSASTVVISTVGTLGKTAVLRDNVNYVFQRSVGIINVDESKLNPWFLKYQLDTNEFQERLIRLSKGAVQRCLFIEDLENLEVNVPPIDIQNRIVKVLNSYDSKISLNNSICSNLEAMAKQLYDYWFVQFDFPDENGKPYKTSGGRMVWNEELKREIPEGWKVGKFGDVIFSINTGLNPRDNFKLNTGGKIKYLTVKNLTTSGNIDFTSCDAIDEEARKIVHRRSDIKIGDILFASISPLGRCYVIKNKPEDWDINESVFSIRPKYDVMTSNYLYMCFMDDTFVKKAEGSSTGSVFKGIRIAELQGLTTIIPSRDILDKFDKQIENMFTMKSNIFEENQQLTSLRDFLLPMLMNGQVKVK